MRSTLEILQWARALYSENPSHAPFGKFTDHCPARCIERAGGDYGGEAERALFEAAALDPDPDVAYARVRVAIIKWNAATTTEEVLAAFDRAISTVAVPHAPGGGDQAGGAAWIAGALAAPLAGLDGLGDIDRRGLPMGGGRRQPAPPEVAR